MPCRRKASAVTAAASGPSNCRPPTVRRWWASNAAATSASTGSGGSISTRPGDGEGEQGGHPRPPRTSRRGRRPRGGEHVDERRRGDGARWSRGPCAVSAVISALPGRAGDGRSVAVAHALPSGRGRARAAPGRGRAAPIPGAGQQRGEPAGGRAAAAPDVEDPHRTGSQRGGELTGQRGAAGAAVGGLAQVEPVGLGHGRLGRRGGRGWSHFEPRRAPRAARRWSESRGGSPDRRRAHRLAARSGLGHHAAVAGRPGWV